MHRHGHRPVPQKVGRAVARDGRDPARERGGLAQRPQPLERRQKNVLHEIGRVLRRQADDQNRVHVAREALVERAERLAVPGLRGADEIRDGLARAGAIGVESQKRCAPVSRKLRSQCCTPSTVRTGRM